MNLYPPTFVRVMTGCLLVLSVPSVVAASDLRLTLGDAARRAAVQSAVPEAARERVSAARSGLQTARGELLPSITATAATGERTFNSADLGIDLGDVVPGRERLPAGGVVIGPIRNWDARVSVRMSIFDVAALGRARVAGATVRATRTEALDASQEAATDAAVEYVRVQRSLAHIAARQTDSTLAEDLLGIARDQRAAGLGTELDEARARTRLISTRAGLIQARADRDDAMWRLRRAVGLPLDAPLIVADSLPAPDAPPGDSDGRESTAVALRQREDLRALDSWLDVTRRQAAAIRAERLPALSVAGDYGGTGIATSRLLATYAWGVRLSLPVFDGLQREGRIASQRSAARELDIRRRDLVERIRLEVREALGRLVSAREQAVASEERLRFARLALAQARDRLMAGIAGNADVINALIEVNEALAARVDARADHQTARVALARAQGAVTALP